MIAARYAVAPALTSFTMAMRISDANWSGLPDASHFRLIVKAAPTLVILNA